ncbi:hypothetical protein O4J56_04785 [Nocardiopsis sp. RSe5-2]|uniref:Phosphatidate cytidylyltransferase n=1 Tax=Nocardiopsis endophytica TaxID=3018445 RepID=A0ABT4U0E5_9ACTN|nr:hypothetical protein [Nocardiopsis endophytica]MDA2809945.1 hypothetical protein [Nocardiopsis endophytica]
MATPDRTDDPPPAGTRLSTRTALVVLASLMCAAVVTGLAWWAGRHPAEAALAGLLALGGAFKFMDSLIS